MQNNKLSACIGVLAVFSLQLSSNGLMATPLDAIRVGGDVFLYGDNIEVGIAENGAFGTSQFSPTGKKQGKVLGYISDPSKKKFANGYHGDFFLPKVSEEGWAITLNNEAYNNNSNLQTTEIPGGFISENTSTSTAMTVWQGEINGLKVTQNFRIYKAGLAVIIDISLQNTTSSLMRDVYYMRTVDPDNNAEQNNPTQDPHYITINTIMRQGGVNGGAAVVAKQSIIPQASNQITRVMPSVLGLCGHGANSRVTHGGNGDGDKYNPYYRYPDKVYNSAKIAGDSKEEDAPIAIAFKLDKIFPGQTVKFRAGYQLADITAPSIDIDTDNSSKGLGNTFLQVYRLGDVATKITDIDTSITGLDQDALLVGASIKISNAHESDQLATTGLLPDGISIDTEEESSDSEIHLTGTAIKSAYIQALQQITFINQATTASAETRHISIMVLDSNYTASTAAESILEIITPITLNDDAVTDNNMINASEENGVLLSGTAAPNLPIKIIFTDKDGQQVSKTVTSDGNGIWTLANDTVDISALADGAMTVKITSTDANGNQSSYVKETQKDSTVLLDVTTPEEGEIAISTSPVITGKSDPNATISLSLNGNSYTTTANDSGQWSYTLPEQPLGSTTTLSISANDAANNTNSKELTLTIPSIPLTITVVEPSTTPVFTGTSTPNTKITVTIPTPNGGSESCTTTTDATGNWSCQLPTLPSGGPYVASIKTEDDKGHSSTKTYDVTIPDLPLVIESPTHNSSISDSSPTVSGSSNPDSTITVTASTGEKCITIADVLGKWSCELPILPLASDITLSVTTKDEANNTTTESIKIKTPSLPLKITGIDISTTPTFTGTSAPNTNITVTVPISDTKSETCTTTTKADGSWSCKLPALPSGGPYTATVKAEDNNGNYATDTQVLSTPELSLSVDSHADDASIRDTTPTISGISTPATNITLTASTGQTCTTVTDAEGHWSCKLPVLPLSETLNVIIKTEDSVGNSNTKTISLTTPALPISITGIEASTTPSIIGTSTADTLITVSIVIDSSTTESCTATTDSEGNWSCQISALPSGGPYTATVTADDSKGNTSSITEDFTVPELPLIIDSPTNNAVISGTTPTVSGTSLPATTITVTISSGQSCTAITDSSNHWGCELDSLPLGASFTLTVMTEDSAGNKTTESIEITTNKLPLDIITPGDKGTASDSTPTFVGTSVAGANITVTEEETGAQCQTVADENGNWSCELTQLPVGGPYTINIKSEDDQGNVTEVTENISIPKIDLVITSPRANETITGTSFIVTGTSDPNTPIIILGSDGEKCSTTSNDKGKWSCELENLQSGNGKHITVISGDEEEGQKFSLVTVDIKNSAEKVTTIIKGGAGALSLFFLFLLSLTLLPKFVRLMRSQALLKRIIINKNKV